MSGYDEDKQFVVSETRRKWSGAERERIVTETRTASVSSVARKHGVAASLLFRWRREAGIAGKTAGRRGHQAFLPVVTAATPAPSPESAGSVANGTIEIELANGHKLRVSGRIEAEQLRQVIAALAAR